MAHANQYTSGNSQDKNQRGGTREQHVKAGQQSHKSSSSSSNASSGSSSNHGARGSNQYETKR